MYLIHFRLARSLLGDQKQTFGITNRKNGSFKITLSQPLNIYTVDAIEFLNIVIVVKFTVSTKNETLLSFQGCKNEKKSLDQDKI